MKPIALIKVDSACAKFIIGQFGFEYHGAIANLIQLVENALANVLSTPLWHYCKVFNKAEVFEKPKVYKTKGGERIFCQINLKFFLLQKLVAETIEGSSFIYWKR